MTLNTNDVRNEYTATGGQTVFNYTFKIYEDTDLNVYVTPAGQDCSSGDLTTSYTVSGVGLEDGGSITLTTPSTANDLVTIVSSIPSDRTVDYQNNGDFRPDTVNDDLDRTLSISKQSDDRVGRTLAFLECEQGVSGLVLPKPESGLFLKWRQDLLGVESSGAPGSIVNTVEFGVVSDMVADNTLEIGDIVVTTGYTAKGDAGYNMYEIVAAGTGTDDGGSFIDLVTHQAKGLFPGGEYRVEQFGALLDGANNDGVPCQNALYAAEAASAGLVTAGPGTIQIGDPVLPTAIFVPANVSFIGAPSFSTKISKSVFGSSSGFHVINGKPDATENYHDPLGNLLNGTGDPISARNNKVANFEIQNGIGVWTVKARDCGVEYLMAGTGALTAAAFGNDATEDCVSVYANHIFRNATQTAAAWYTIGFFRTTGLTVNTVIHKAKGNSAAIKVDESSDGNFTNVYVDQQDKLFNGIDCSQSTNISVDESCTFVNCLSGFVSFANTAPFDANNTFSGRTKGCTNHVRLYTRNNSIIGSVNIDSTNDVVLESDALLNIFIGNDFRAKTLVDGSSLVDLQDWIGNRGLQEGIRSNLSTVDQILRNSTNANISLSSTGEARVGAATGQSLFLGANGDPLTVGMGATLFRPGTDNAMDLGLISNRWREVFAVNGTINTSDKTEKTDFKEIPQYMKDAGVEIKGNIQLWKWISAVESKGGEARYHVGPLAQDVYDIVKKHIDMAGVDDDPFNYSFLCRDDITDDDGLGEKGAIIGERWGLRPTDLLFLIMASI